jgi:hypothetical protein
VMQASELQEAAQLAAKYQMPALIVHPGLSGEAILARGKLSGKFKIITPVDWPKGDVFGMNKLRGLSTDSLETDGFELLLTPGKNEIETRNEAKVLTEFIRAHLAEEVEVRFVLGALVRPPEEVERLCAGLLKIRTPAMIRNDTHLKVQVSKANTTTHMDTVTLIKSKIQAPIKIAGNIGDVRTITSCRDVARFGVSLLQARNIIKEMAQQPAELKALLD